MKITIVTPCFNSEATIGDCVASIASQDYENIEHIVVDGGSTDRTLEILRSNGVPEASVLRGPDEGIYDAMNKGIRAASGDVIGILNSDDMYNRDDVISRVADAFREREAEIVFGDLHYVRAGELDKPIRYYSSASFKPWKFRFGFMPAHPAMFIRRELHEEHGFYKTDYRIAADIELLIRLLAVQGVSYHYLPIDMVKMRAGGASNESLRSKYTLNREVVRACRENGIYTNLALQIPKYLIKLFELYPKG